MGKITITLADSQYLIRKGLRHLIASNPKLEVVSEALNRHHLIKQVSLHQPDVVILDYNNSNCFTIEDIGEIKKLSSSTKVLVISSDESRGNINAVLEKGINSFLTKECDEEEIISAIYATARGEKFFCNKILDVLLEKHLSKEDQNCKPAHLTSRELEIVKMISDGHSTKEIAENLSLSHHTIYTHRKNVMKKLNLKSASELIIYALNEGISKQKQV